MLIILIIVGYLFGYHATDEDEFRPWMRAVFSVMFLIGCFTTAKVILPKPVYNFITYMPKGD